jgi:EAL domain-containing protein (putative c-di-GMP-specific phosphodiesterase class I)
VSLETATPAARTHGAELLRILDHGLVRAVYQPIVELDTGALVGFEALARGPEDSALQRPDMLFAAAREAGLVAELEWACRAAAVAGALQGGLRPPLRLFLNVEPRLIGMPVRPEFRELFARAARELSIVVELTERALADRPADVLAAVARVRELGWTVALDDVGVDWRSVALMPFLEPDVIKLDMHLVQEPTSPQAAAIVHAVSAQAERSGAVVLAEGIETDVQVEVARALGARYGQGWHFGRPGRLPSLVVTGAKRALPGAALETPVARTPFAVLCDRHEPRRGNKRLLYAISRHLETHLDRNSQAAVLLSSFQEARHFTPPTAARYARPARGAAFVGALGADLTGEPAPGVRGASLADAEALRAEWNVIVLDSQFAAAFSARDLGDRGEDAERRFDFCMTYDRELVIAAARTLMERIAGH